MTPSHKAKDETREIKRTGFKEHVQGNNYHVEFIEYNDGAIAISDEMAFDGGFIYFYPKSAERFKKLLAKRKISSLEKENKELKELYENVRTQCDKFASKCKKLTFDENRVVEQAKRQERVNVWKEIAKINAKDISDAQILGEIKIRMFRELKSQIQEAKK